MKAMTTLLIFEHVVKGRISAPRRTLWQTNSLQSLKRKRETIPG